MLSHLKSNSQIFNNTKRCIHINFPNFFSLYFLPCTIVVFMFFSSMVYSCSFVRLICVLRRMKKKVFQSTSEKMLMVSGKRQNSYESNSGICIRGVLTMCGLSSDTQKHANHQRKKRHDHQKWQCIHWKCNVASNRCESNEMQSLFLLCSICPTPSPPSSSLKLLLTIHR